MFHFERLETERHIGLGSTGASYSKGLGLKSRLKIRKNWRRCFIQSLHTNMRIAPQIGPRPLLPIHLQPIMYSQPFGSTLFSLSYWMSC